MTTGRPKRDRSSSLLARHDDGQVAKAGAVTAPGGGTFSFNPGDGLPHGDYTIWLAVSVNDNLMNPEIRTVTYRR